VLCLLGVALWILAAVRSGHEPRSYSAGSPPPVDVSLTAGHNYSVSTAGGLDAVRKVVEPADLTCTITPRGAESNVLAVTPETSDKALHQIGTFVAPVSGPAQIACANIGDVYVDDADGSNDYAGVLRLLATLLLVVGAPLALSALRGRGRDRARPLGRDRDRPQGQIDPQFARQ